jgi:very-short-patch-repair endonuclease
MSNKSKSLAEIHPEISKEWHPYKNGTLSPYDVTPGSGKRVWWKCSKGHEWLAFINNRTRGAGCPFCSGRYATRANSLIFLYPEIAKEWHPIKNEKLTPDIVSFGSHKKVWWLCRNKHEWQASPNNRVRGKGCPYCAKKIADSENNLVSLFPHIAEQWHSEKNTGLFPEMFRSQSNKKVWWKCNRGHEWQARIQDRTLGTSCPFCSNKTSQLEIRIYCELKQIFTTVEWRKKLKGVEVDILLPEEKIGIEIDGYHWHHKNHKRDEHKNKHLQSLGIKLIRVRENPLIRISEDDLIYINNIGEKDVINGLLTKLLKFVNHSYGVPIRHYLQISSFMNLVEFRKILSYLPGPPLEESLEITNPNLIIEWNNHKNAPLLPRHFSSQSNKKVWWKCKRGHEWQSHIYTRTKGIGCPYCSGRLATKTTNLKVLRPDLSEEWHPTKNNTLTPEDVTQYSHKAVWWLCRKGHEWQAVIANRANMCGCPFCSGKKVSSDNCLAVLRPELAIEWHNERNQSIRQTDVTLGSGKKVWWKCSEGHEWQAAIYSRVKGNGCPYCGKKLASPTVNLSVVFPHLANEWHPSKNGDIKPEELRPKSNRKVWWLCRKGHEWEATINNRAHGQGCPYCSGKRRTGY